MHLRAAFAIQDCSSPRRPHLESAGRAAAMKSTHSPRRQLRLANRHLRHQYSAPWRYNPELGEHVASPFRLGSRLDRHLRLMQPDAMRSPIGAPHLAASLIGNALYALKPRATTSPAEQIPLGGGATDLTPTGASQLSPGQLMLLRNGAQHGLSCHSLFRAFSGLAAPESYTIRRNGRRGCVLLHRHMHSTSGYTTLIGPPLNGMFGRNRVH